MKYLRSIHYFLEELVGNFQNKHFNSIYKIGIDPLICLFINSFSLIEVMVVILSGIPSRKITLE